jgi:hypothetical protein
MAEGEHFNRRCASGTLVNERMSETVSGRYDGTHVYVSGDPNSDRRMTDRIGD